MASLSFFYPFPSAAFRHLFYPFFLSNIKERRFKKSYGFTCRPAGFPPVSRPPPPAPGGERQKNIRKGTLFLFHAWPSYGPSIATPQLAPLIQPRRSKALRLLIDPLVFFFFFSFTCSLGSCRLARVKRQGEDQQVSLVTKKKATYPLSP